ncbi:unnamed protein product [Chrysodeixis includens]|uniref:Uncharacterized protein n=1 Tax=Chrysodeixis includens TaxID=689277 RepID=A0A9N8Q2E4_CHRIL|nr:unnamed protein product [Chrysodeixis includens]
MTDVEKKILQILGDDFGRGLSDKRVEPFEQIHATMSPGRIEPGPSTRVTPPPPATPPTLEHTATATADLPCTPRRSPRRRRHAQREPPITQDAVRRALIRIYERRANIEEQNRDDLGSGQSDKRVEPFEQIHATMSPGRIEPGPSTRVTPPPPATPPTLEHTATATADLPCTPRRSPRRRRHAQREPPITQDAVRRALIRIYERRANIEEQNRDDLGSGQSDKRVEPFEQIHATMSPGRIEPGPSTTVTPPPPATQPTLEHTATATADLPCTPRRSPRRQRHAQREPPMTQDTARRALIRISERRANIEEQNSETLKKILEEMKEIKEILLLRYNIQESESLEMPLNINMPIALVDERDSESILTFCPVQIHATMSPGRLEPGPSNRVTPPPPATPPTLEHTATATADLPCTPRRSPRRRRHAQREPPMTQDAVRRALIRISERRANIEEQNRDDFGSGLPDKKAEPFEQNIHETVSLEMPLNISMPLALEDERDSESILTLRPVQIHATMSPGKIEPRPSTRVTPPPPATPPTLEHTATATADLPCTPRRSPRRRRHAQREPPMTQDAARRALIRISERRANIEEQNSETLKKILEEMKEIKEILRLRHNIQETESLEMPLNISMPIALEDKRDSESILTLRPVQIHATMSPGRIEPGPSTRVTPPPPATPPTLEHTATATVWADWKSKTKKKALTIRHHARGTGGRPASGQTLSASEERVLAIMGALAVKGGRWGQDSVDELEFNGLRERRTANILLFAVRARPSRVPPLAPCTIALSRRLRRTTMMRSNKENIPEISNKDSDNSHTNCDLQICIAPSSGKQFRTICLMCGLSPKKRSEDKTCLCNLQKITVPRTCDIFLQKLC